MIFAKQNILQSALGIKSATKSNEKMIFAKQNILQSALGIKSATKSNKK